MKRALNLFEMRAGVVHADGPDGLDYTLCGVTAENVLEWSGELTADMLDRETETEPILIKTTTKVTCNRCADIIRYCCRMGLRSIHKSKRHE